MKIYTKAGDTGDTSLWGVQGEKRTRKNSQRVECYGAVDEANAMVGLAVSLGVGDATLAERLTAIQHRLFAMGADLANINPERVNRLTAEDVTCLEAWIDDLDATLPALRSFILPGGSPAASQLHVARTVVRRAERRLVALMEEDSSYRVHLMFLNRLSDFLFVAARRANQALGVNDVVADF
ncbi:MAG: cob(I)yrinic acid a,c-diamide adenosyltransferase [Firmicutes bacterium]|jgi:cob(I)alamin adenosyltransferase|nr:cob(I)yrinic acid a,c-diamide adenosyltransferase [Bacillota bacterium]